MDKIDRKNSKGRKILGSILLIVCAVALLYFAAVMIYRFCTFSAEKRLSALPRFLAELGVTCLLAIPALDIRFKLFSWKKNTVAKVFGIGFRVMSVLFVVLFVALVATIAVIGSHSDEREVKNVCVLGLAINGDELPEDLLHRLDKAIEYKTAHPDVVLITTGGNNEDPTMTEAAQMKRYLCAEGLKEEDIIAETEARTTVENFVKVVAFVDKTEALGVITNDYHIFRATRIAKKQGYLTLVDIPAPSNPLTYFENVTWEGICAISETLRGNMAF